MATLQPMPERECDRCGKRATVKLLNRALRDRGYYCRRCGRIELRQLQAAEDEQAALDVQDDVMEQLSRGEIVESRG